MDNSVKTERISFPLWKILFKNLILIIVLTVLCTLSGTVYGKLTVKPVYTAKSTVILTTSLDPSSVAAGSASTDLSLSKLTLPSIISLISSPETISVANDIYKGEGEITEGNIGTVSGDTCIFSIYYVDSDPTIAKEKLEAVISGTRAIFTKYEQEGKKIISAGEVDFIPTQTEPSVSYSDKSGQYVLIGFATGLILSLLIAVLIYLFDNKVKDISDLEEISGSSVIAFISKQ